jgi:hypothetical protein
MKRAVLTCFLALCAVLVSVLFAGCGDDSMSMMEAGPDAAAPDAGQDAVDVMPIDSRADMQADGPTSFNVASAQSTAATRMTVMFDAPPDPAEAVVLGNYTVPGLTLSGKPTLQGNIVSITTSVQAAMSYTLTVTNVTRASDTEPLKTATAMFTGRTPFNVTGAASTNSKTVTVTFDAAPNMNQATTLNNYAINGLMLSGMPQLNGNTVTLTTSTQGAQSYTVTVMNVTRASDGEPLLNASAMLTGTTGFNVASAQSTANKQMTVTFDAAPNTNQATNINNYAVNGLTLSNPQLNGSTVTLTTTAQSAQMYTINVSNVTRAMDAEPLTTGSASFTGRTSFNVASAASTTNKSMTVTFDAPPNAGQATSPNNYNVPGLTLSNGQLNGSTVTFTTTSQAAQGYSVTVSNVTRNADSEPLTTNSAGFTGRTAFNVQSAASTNAITMTVTFDAPPNVGQATSLNNYSVNGLVLSGTPTLVNNTVTIQTSGQSAQGYTAVVSNVGRASDGEPLSVTSANFTGTAVKNPTVTNVVVKSTSPNNGVIPYNTGTATVTITGTDLGTVVCPGGVKLDDLDGVGTLVGTSPTSCTVDNDTQITATFPAGIRTNASAGWNVQATNMVGSNATSSVKFVPVAGLTISEVLIATGTASHEYIEIYNPTGTSIDTTSNGIGLHLHIRTGTGTDNGKVLTAVTSGIIPSHGFCLLVSDQASAESWWSTRDYTYVGTSNTLVSGGGTYISLSGTGAAKVIDKVGWGTQPVNGYETTALPDISASNSVERKPAGGQGHATDTDVNSADFNAQSTTLTPRGTADQPQP